MTHGEVTGEPALPLAIVDEPPADRFAEVAVPIDGIAAALERLRAKGAARKHAQHARARAEHAAMVRAEVTRPNRDNAVQTVEENGLVRYFARCACNWCGLRVDDPELARREYDAHPCTITGDDAVERAQQNVDRDVFDRATGKLVVPKRTADQMQVATGLRHDVETSAAPAITQTEDDAAQRFALLELDR